MGRVFRLVLAAALLVASIGTAAGPDPTPTPVPGDLPLLGQRAPQDGSGKSAFGHTTASTAGQGRVISDANLRALAAEGKVSVGGGVLPGLETEGGDPGPGQEEGEVQRLEADLRQLQEELAQLQATGDQGSEQIRASVRRIEQKMGELAVAKMHQKQAQDSRAMSRPTDAKSIWVVPHNACKSRIEALKARIAQLETECGSIMPNTPGEDRMRKIWVPGYSQYTHPLYVEDPLGSPAKHCDELKNKQSELQSAEQELAKILEQARRDGAEPGWFR